MNGEFYRKAAFAVPRRAGKAFWRNRTKRLMRESFRLNRDKIFGLKISGAVRILCLAHSLNQKDTPKPDLKLIMPEMNGLMRKLRETNPEIFE